MHIQRFTTGKLPANDLVEINHYRVQEFGIEDLGGSGGSDGEENAIYFLLKNESNKLLSFALVEELTVYLRNKSLLVFCVSTVISTQKGKGYGLQVLKEIQQLTKDKGKTLLGFCETDMIPFYKKCGFSILSNEDNQFVYCDAHGNIIPKIIPGEVFYLEGSDAVVKSILSNSDKRVLVPRK